MTIDEAVKRVFEKCDICYDNSIISKESLLRSYAEFVTSTIDKDKHNVGIVMHPGSVCFDVVSVVIAALMNLINNETDSRVVVESLIPGDIVIYKNERHVFSGIIDGETVDRKYKGIRYAILTQERTSKYGASGSTYLSEQTWGKILPYNGKSKITDGRGIKKKTSARRDFFDIVLDYAEEDIPSIVDTSSVLVMPRSKADDMVNNISIRFWHGKRKINLLELVTASYYSEEEERTYSGNIGKNEPVLKFCSKISVARKQILSRKGNKHIGLMVFGQDTIDRSQSELPELLERESLKYVYLCTTIDSGYGLDLLRENQNIQLYACTKDFLKEQSELDVREENIYTRELSERVKYIKNCEIVSETINGFPLDVKEELSFRNTLLKIKRNEYESDAKNEFVMQAFSLMNLFKTATFTVEDVIGLCMKDEISVIPPNEKITRLSELKLLLPNAVKDDVERVINAINSVNSCFLKMNPKKQWLQNYLRENKDKKIAVVVPRAYYITILKDSSCLSPVLTRNVVFVTAERFDTNRIYDEIILVGDFSGKRFDAFRCNSANKIIGLFYPVEILGFNSKKNKKVKDDYLLSSRSTIKVTQIKPEEPKMNIEEEEYYDERIEEELKEYFEQSDITFGLGTKWESRENRGNLTTEIVAIATLEDERKVFFSKHYKAYVFDANSGETKEVESQELCEGDSVVFTKNNDDTKDIVDMMLQQLIEDGKLTDNMVLNYNKSKEWKQSLRDYMVINNISITEVANRLIELGVPVQPYTIMRWMDEDTHTVGPRKPESIKLIGKLTGNEKLINEYEDYYLACKEIRSIRRNLLSQIGKAIINKLNGRKPVQGTLFADIFDRIDDLSEVLQIERIISTEKVMPLAVANRPINMRGE